MGRRRVHDEHLRQRLLGAATDLIAASGPDFSLRPLVASVGTSTSAVYSLFGSRGDLVEAVTVRAASSLIHAQRAVAAEGALERIAELARTIRSWAAAHPTMFHVVFGGVSGSEAVAEARDETLAPLIDAVDRASAAGALVDDAGLDGRTVFAAVHGFVSLELLGVFRPEEADTLFDAQLRALWRVWSSEAASARQAAA